MNKTLRRTLKLAAAIGSIWIYFGVAHFLNLEMETPFSSWYAIPYVLTGIVTFIGLFINFLSDLYEV